MFCCGDANIIHNFHFLIKDLNYPEIAKAKRQLGKDFQNYNNNIFLEFSSLLL